MRRRLYDSADAAARTEAEQAAVRLETHLQAGGRLDSVPAPMLALDADESAYADVVCATARFYGTEVVYPRAPAGYFEDHPAFGRRWVPNHRLEARRRQQAEADAEERWRDHSQARVVLTSSGLRISPAGSPGTWLPFDHVLLTGITTAVDRRELVLSYSVCAPLLVVGPAAPWLGVAVRHLEIINGGGSRLGDG
ncbi:hypothetical protein ACFWZ2_37260 [Streptomyces sp. NPDC059002]|uniref:hypothetical protein n=1 Tax=Streptomyces sp. NPDC059002 TaxID=3346690 RepID=UPI0036C3E894